MRVFLDTSAFVKRYLVKTGTDAQYRQLKSLLLLDIEDAAICDLTPAVLAQTIRYLKTMCCAAWTPFISVAP